MSDLLVETSVELTHCPNCAARIVPWRLAAGLTRREMAEYLNVGGSYVAYLDGGNRSPSATATALLEVPN
jgi:transcriptional regulator with XRE-family HTH domain